MSKNLIIFYSRRGWNYVNGSIRNLPVGNVETAAKYVQKAVGGDLFEIEPVYNYSGDYMTCTREAKEELRSKARPELKKYLDDISAYDNIFVMAPCWWGTCPMPVFTQLERLDFTGKKVFPFMSHEGSGLGSCEKDISNSCRGAVLGAGLEIQGTATARSEEKIAAWAGKCTG